jgi:predicted nucleic acid-binding Zn ribbon protein
VNDHDNLVELLLRAATRWDETATFSGGLLRLAARRVTDLERELARLRPTTPLCLHCGEQISAGRKYCASKCRSAAWRERQRHARPELDQEVV